MLQSAEIMLRLCSTQLSLAQIIVDEVTQKKQHLFFSGPQFFVALFAGVLMAFAFQLLLTNFRFWHFIIRGSSDSDDESESLGGTILQN